MRSPTRVIVCGVFRPALEYLELESRYPHVHASFLPSDLHLRPQDLETALRAAIRSAKARNEKVVCLYFNCLADMDSLCHHPALTFHESPLRDPADGRATGQPQDLGPEAYLNSTSQVVRARDARKDAHIRDRSR